MSVHHRIVRNTVVIGLALLAGRLAMLARELAMAGEFGRADDVEGFVIAYLGPLFVVSIVGTGFGYAFIPTYLQVREAQGREAAQRVFASVAGWSLLALALCAAALAAAAPCYLPLLASNFDASKLALTQTLAGMLAPLALLGGMSAIWSALLNAEESLGLPAAATVLESGSVAAFGYGRRFVDVLVGVAALALGTAVFPYLSRSVALRDWTSCA